MLVYGDRGVVLCMLLETWQKTELALEGKIKLYIACSVCFKRSWREGERERLFQFFVTDYTRASKQPRLQCNVVVFLWHRNKLLHARSPIQCKTNIALRGLDQQQKWLEWCRKGGGWGGVEQSNLFGLVYSFAHVQTTILAGQTGSCRVPLNLLCLHSSVIQVAPLWRLLSSF